MIAALTVKAAKACMEAMNRTLCYFIDSHVILREQEKSSDGRRRTAKRQLPYNLLCVCTIQGSLAVRQQAVA